MNNSGYKTVTKGNRVYTILHSQRHWSICESFRNRKVEQNILNLFWDVTGKALTVIETVSKTGGSVYAFVGN